MTNEELRTKIVEVLNTLQDYGYKSYMVNNLMTGEIKMDSHQVVNNRIADALIAAGIGDVKEAEHRAAGAEKELLVYKEVAGAMLCEIGCSNEGYCPEFYKDPECKNCTKKKIYGNFAATSPCLLDKYIQQAEKELAEEGKYD